MKRTLIPWLILVCLTLLQYSCKNHKFQNTWDTPAETSQIIITKHYKPLILENGDMVCGEAIDGINESRGIGECNDTIYLDKDSNILLYKNDITKARSYYNNAGRLYKQIEKNQNSDNETVTTWDYDSAGRPITQTIINRSGQEKSIFTYNEGGKLIKCIKNDSLLIIYHYAPSSSDIEVITEKHLQNNTEIKKIVIVNNTSIDRVISREEERYQQYYAKYDRYQQKIERERFDYNPDGTTKSYYSERRDYNDMLIDKHFMEWEYNSHQDITYKIMQMCMNLTIRMKKPDGSEKVRYSSRYTEQPNYTSQYIFKDYKYDNKGRWIYRTLQKMDKYENDTIICIREIKDI